MDMEKEVEHLNVSAMGGAEDQGPRPKAQLWNDDGGYIVKIIDANGNEIFSTMKQSSPKAAVDDISRLRSILQHIPLKNLLLKDAPPAKPIWFDRAATRPDEGPPPPSEPEPA
jgi:hypothetical protein